MLTQEVEGACANVIDAAMHVCVRDHISCPISAHNTTTTPSTSLLSNIHHVLIYTE